MKSWLSVLLEQMLEMEDLVSHDELQAGYAEYFHDFDLELLEDGPRQQRQAIDTSTVSVRALHSNKGSMFTKMKKGMSKALASAQGCFLQ